MAKKNNNMKKKGRNVSTAATGGYANPATRPRLTRSRGPVMTNTENGVIISNTERLSNSAIQTGGTGLLRQAFPLNPASSNLFPWLVRIAQSYSMYRWKSLRVYYVPIVPTTQGGYVEAAAYYDYEDVTNWVANGPDNLSFNGQWTSGPLYAGGALNTSTDKVDDCNALYIDIDVTRMHSRVPWFVIDPTTATSELSNNAIGAWAAFLAYQPAAANILAGIPYVSYEIELIHPVATSVQTSQNLVARAAFGDDGPMYPPGSEPTPFPGAPIKDSKTIQEEGAVTDHM